MPLKIRKTDLLYLFQLTFIGVFLLVLLGYRFQTDKKNFFENEMFSENVKGLRMSSFQLAENVCFPLSLIPPDQPCSVSRYLSGSEHEIVRGVYDPCDVFGFAERIGQGRYFSAADFASAAKTAVIGSSIADSPACISRGGKRCYLYENTAYEVIGEFAVQDNLADKAVFLNLPALDAQIGQLGGVYYFDAKSADTVRSVTEQVLSGIGGAFTVSEVEFVPRTSRQLNILFRSMFLCCTLSALLCLAVTTFFVVSGEQYSTAVRKLCGMTSRGIFVLYGRRMLAVTAAAFLLIFVTMHLLTASGVPVFANCGISGWHYLAAACILLGISGCNTLYITRLCCAADISSVLKGI